MTIGPAPALPHPPAIVPQNDRLAIVAGSMRVVQQGMPPGALSAIPAAGDDWTEQCGEGVATLLEACGENGPWQYAVTGSAIGIVLGGMRLAQAQGHGDAAGLQAGLFKIGLSGLGLVAGSGVLHAHPAIQAALEAARTVFGSVTLPAQPSPSDQTARRPVMK